MKHEAVDGGFVCRWCGTSRRTPLGISRHRALCPERPDSEEGDRP